MNNGNNIMNNNNMNNKQLNMNNFVYFDNLSQNNYFKKKKITFFIRFNGTNYKIVEFNDKKTGDVINEFLNNNPEIKKLASNDQKYLFDSYNLQFEKTLFENKIDENSIILMPFQN